MAEKKTCDANELSVNNSPIEIWISPTAITTSSPTEIVP
jgi:hypothetical protein